MLHCYGSICCRGDVETFKFEISEEEVQKAISIRELGQEDVLEDYSDNITDSNYQKVVVLVSIADFNSEVDISKWENDKVIMGCLEEYEYGVAPTLKEAKLAYIDVSEG